jgi:immune inhibitor InhA-like protein
MARLTPALIALLLGPFLVATPAPAQAAPPVPAPAARSDTRELSRTHFTLNGKALPEARYRRSPTRRAAPVATPAVGTTRDWLGLNDILGTYYAKSYTLRASGAHIEVWVASDLAFPAGDCRKTPVAVTDAQVAGLITEFDKNIYPKETTAFSTPPDRDGSKAVLPGNYTGAGDKTVTLIDNVRDANFTSFPENATYIAGFFSAQLNEMFDRNVMTIDAYDWLHRTGARPVNAATDDLCTSRPSRPRLYEGTFAHEWQHLLQYYTDPREALWINEGLSDYAQTLVGYVDGNATVYHAGGSGHLYCFQGFGVIKTKYNTNPRPCGGAQNSLNLWNEGATDDVLADYGNTYAFMLYLHDRFGPALLTALHRDKAHQGLAGVEAALPPGASLYGVIHDYQTMTLVDKDITAIDGAAKNRVTAASLRSTVNLGNPSSYDLPGAAPNGADYVRLRDAGGGYLRGRDLRSVTFRGAKSLPPLPLTWAAADGALFSGNRSDTDAAAIIGVAVPAADPTLRFTTRYGMEAGFDYGYVTVSTDGGRTYVAVGGDRTAGSPLGPAINGASAGSVRLSYDLSAYRGKQILLGFRYVTDGGVNEGGWFVDDIAVGAVPVGDGSSVDGFRSPTQIVPTPVHAFDVKLIGLSGSKARVVRVAQFAKLQAFDTVVAVVAYDEPTELITQHAPYLLTANGAKQPG